MYVPSDSGDLCGPQMQNSGHGSSDAYDQSTDFIGTRNQAWGWLFEDERKTRERQEETSDACG
jgi:hypothetical protein